MTKTLIEPWIQTLKGNKFNFDKPDPDSISEEDIAIALSHLCRFTGHLPVGKFFSVGEHSLNVCRWLGADADPAVMLAGLLHDASEAYMGDINSPLKAMNDMRGYKRIEKIVQGAINLKFGLTEDAHNHPLIKQADNEMKIVEARYFYNIDAVEEWNLKPATKEFTLRRWPMEEVPTLFLAGVRELKERINGLDHA